MTVKEFVEKYNKMQNKALALKDLKVKQYVPFETKIDLCQRVINNTCYREVTGKKEYFANSPARYMFYCLTLIDAYTDIQINFKEGLESYNLLDQSGLIEELIFHQIPESEYKMMDVIMKMKMDDIHENELSAFAITKNKLESVGLFLDQLASINIPVSPKILK